MKLKRIGDAEIKEICSKKAMMAEDWCQLQVDVDKVKVDELEARIKELEAINEEHRKLNGRLREQLNNLARITKDDVIKAGAVKY